MSGIALLAALLMAAPVMAAEDDAAQADWLYLSPGFGWVQQSQTVEQFPFDVSLPVRHQDIQDLWWASHPDDHNVRHLHGLEDRLLVPGSTVIWRATGADEQRGEVMQVLASGLLIAFADQARIIAPEDYHRLSLPLSGQQSGRLVFESTQDTPATRTWAYRTGLVSGQVVYSLDMSADQPVLYQDLRIENPGDQAVQAEGLSYHPGNEGGRRMMTSRALGLESMADAGYEGPSEGVSGQQAVLTWPQPVLIAAQSTQWVRVQDVPLTDVTHEYRWRWQGQATTATPAQWFLQIFGENDLPRLPGAVAVSWFDQAAASLHSTYQPHGEQEAVLALGTNTQVTLTAQATAAPGVWQLRLHNRLESAAAARLELQHPRTHQVNVPPRTEALMLEPGTTELTVRFTDQGIDVDVP